MIRKLFQKIFTRPVLWYMRKYSARPVREKVFKALDELYASITTGEKKKGLVVPFDISTGRFIIFSDHHKGSRNGADDFLVCEPNYLAALDYYYDNGYTYIALGDCEELWENLWPSIRLKHKPAFEKEKAFLHKNAFIKIFGNHDLFWDNDPFAPVLLKEVYGETVKAHEGVVLETRIGEQVIHIFCTHGHQGDEVSDGNWFSKFFVSRIWAPFQAFLRINPNTPAYDADLKTLHNTIMHEWSEEKENLLLITGHTHQPVFESLTHLERLYRELLFARQQKNETLISSLISEIRRRRREYDNIADHYLDFKPNYFNTGCCCYNDGDITGIEIENNCIRLVKWTYRGGERKRMILEESSFHDLLSWSKPKR